MTCLKAGTKCAERSPELQMVPNLGGRERGDAREREARGGVTCAVWSLSQGRGGQRLMRRRYESSEMPGSRTRPVLLELKMDGRCRDESEYGQH